MRFAKIYNKDKSLSFDGNFITSEIKGISEFVDDKMKVRTLSGTLKELEVKFNDIEKRIKQIMISYFNSQIKLEELFNKLTLKDLLDKLELIEESVKKIDSKMATNDYYNKSVKNLKELKADIFNKVFNKLNQGE